MSGITSFGELTAEHRGSYNDHMARTRLKNLELHRGKRTVYQRENDLKRLSRLLFTGDYTYQQMADIINKGRDEKQCISASQIALDVKKLREEWAEKRTDTIDYLVNRELARLQVLEDSLWDAIRKEKRTISTTKSDGASSETVEELAPNPALYDKVLAVHKERRKLLGLYAPSVNLVANVEVKGYSVVSPDDWPETDETVEGQYQIKDSN